MSPSHDDAESLPSEQPTGPLHPDAERLFGLGSDAWASRLKSAHEEPDLGRLGPYQLLGEVGRGGQGEVYRAVQPGTGRIIALKRVAGLGLAPNASLMGNFEREVKALTRLSHPNVVTVYTLDVVDGHAVLIMEYVEGRHIDQWADGQWRNSPNPLRSVLGTFARACDGVSHAHQRGVIHRDLKPSNILVTDEDQPKVLDFGIARLLGEQAATEANPQWAVTGFAGTPAYASPEQLHPGPGGIDTRCDVYSLGILLFRLLTGREARDSKAGIAAVIKQASEGNIQAPSRLRRGLPGECDWIVRKATEPDPARRYQSVDALAEDVRRLLDGRPVLARPPSAIYSVRRAVQRRPWLGLGIAASVAIIAALGITAAVQAARLSVRAQELAAALETATREKERAERGEHRQTALNQRLLEATMGAANDTAFVTSTDVKRSTALAGLVDRLTPEDSEETALELRMRLGFALRSEQRLKEADLQFAAAQAISERIDSPSSERAVRLAARRADVLWRIGKREEGLACIERGIERALQAPSTIYIATLLWERLSTLEALKAPTEDVLVCGAALVAWCDQFPERRSERARAREEAAGKAYVRQSYSESERWIREAIEIAEGGGIDAKSLSRFRFRLAEGLLRVDRLQEAEPLARAAADYRVASEKATGGRASVYTRRHAWILHRLGRFTEAADRWEQTLLRPLSEARPNQQEVAQIRLALAAARIGAGDESAGLAALAQALSAGRTTRRDDPEIHGRADDVLSAMRESGWQLNESIRPALGEHAWLLDAFVLPDPSTPIEEPE